MAPRLSGQNCKFFKFLLSSNSQKRLRYKENNTKYRSLTRKPRSHVRILIYRTWPIARETRRHPIQICFVIFQFIHCCILCMLLQQLNKMLAPDAVFCLFRQIRPSKMFLVRIYIKKESERAFLVIYYFLMLSSRNYYLPPGTRWSS